MKLPDLMTGFKMLKEVDLNAVRKQAEEPLHIMIVGDDADSRAALIDNLLTGLKADENPGFAYITVHQPESFRLPDKDALVLLLPDNSGTGSNREKEIFESLVSRKIAVVACLNKPDLSNQKTLRYLRSTWGAVPTAVIDLYDRDTLINELVPAVLRVYKTRPSRLARHLPLFRETVVQKLVNDTCLVNATYSLSTGLAEIVPVLNLPLSLADIIVLTKNQALMAYEITLAMGMKAEWRDTIPKLATVVGSAFLWRQMARYLAGLIPVIGIVPKIVISYSGTYVIGEAIYKWCTNGEKLKPAELKALYKVAVERGSRIVKELINKEKTARENVKDKLKQNWPVITESISAARPQFPVKLFPALSYISGKGRGAGRQLTNSNDKVLKTPFICPYCNKKAPRGAYYCAYCGKPLVKS